MADRPDMRVQWPVVRLVATRLAVREHPPRKAVMRTFWTALALTLVSAGLLALGVSSLVLVAVVGVGALLALGAGCVRLFPAAMAVSVVGIALACASLMTALSVASGFEREITEAVGRMGGHVRVTKYGLDFFEYQALGDRWREDPRVVADSPFAYATVAIVGGVEPPSPNAAPAPVDPDALPPDDPWAMAIDAETKAGLGGAPPTEVRPPVIALAKGLDPVRAGRMQGFAELMDRGDLSGLRPGDYRHPPGIVLGHMLARALGVKVGDHVRVVVPAELHEGGTTEPEPRHATFEVLDLFRSGTSEYDRNFALLHLTAAQALFFREGRVTGIEFQLRDAEEAEDVAEAIMEADPNRWLRASTWRETNAPLLVGLDQIRMSLQVVLGLMVLVAASSLISSLLLVVRRKHHDIGVVLGLGGESRLVFWCFEAIGVMAGLCGALFGIAVGALFCGVIAAYNYPLGGDVYPVDHLPVVMGLGDTLGPAITAVLLCAFASGPVAVLATRVSILQALHR